MPKKKEVKEKKSKKKVSKGKDKTINENPSVPSVNFSSIEKKWREAWKKEKVFQAKMSGNKDKYYILDMFVYPSGNAHMGHVRNYSISDVVARYKRMQGYNVLFPTGFDGFGLPAENAAMEQNIKPDIWTLENIKKIEEDYKTLGFSYDWSREIITCNPEYYKWQQLFFIKMLKKELTYRKKSLVNYCPSCKTVLANEQVSAEGKCWRCNSIVEERELEQWFFKITSYANELYEEIDKLDWPEKVKIMQKNWIGKSQGVEITFKLKEKTKKEIKVFTTRPDTLYGCTFLAISPELELAKKLIKQEHKNEAKRFYDKLKGKTNIERIEKGKEGFFTGSFAINPVNDKMIPIYIAEYVLKDYGTGIIMCVPAHDQRDFEFAKKHLIPIKTVIIPKDEQIRKNENIPEAYEGEGVMINSGGFNDISNKDAIEKITETLIGEGKAKRTFNFKIRDWLVSRQRYWGCPIPVVYCDKCGIVPVPESDLPVQLPDSDKVKFGKGNPLETFENFVNVKCPKCGKSAKRETDTMDTFVDSSWYLLRYPSLKNKKQPFDKETKYWLPIDFYVGGIEHATGHLIYARFFTKVLSDLGYFKFREPVNKLLCQGMVTLEGSAMSKSKGNIILPREMIDKYSVDSLRLYVLSSSLPTSDFEWNDKGIEGVHKFLIRVYNLLTSEHKGEKNFVVQNYLLNEKEILIEEFTKLMDELKFNLAVAKLFIFFDKFSKFRKYLDKKAFKECSETVLKLLNPFTPFITEEIWSLNHKPFLCLSSWPEQTKEPSEKMAEQGKIMERVVFDVRRILNLIRKKKTPEKVYLYTTPKEKEEFVKWKEFLIGQLNLPVEIFSSIEKGRYDPLDKSGKAEPGRPAVYIE